MWIQTNAPFWPETQFSSRCSWCLLCSYVSMDIKWDMQTWSRRLNTPEYLSQSTEWFISALGRNRVESMTHVQHRKFVGHQKVISLIHRIWGSRNCDRGTKFRPLFFCQDAGKFLSGTLHAVNTGCNAQWICPCARAWSTPHSPYSCVIFSLFFVSTIQNPSFFLFSLSLPFSHAHADLMDCAHAPHRSPSWPHSLLDSGRNPGLIGAIHCFG